jgi:hypothetical protein
VLSPEIVGTTEILKPKRPLVIWFVVLPALLLVGAVLLTWAVDLARAPGFMVAHPIKTIFLPLAKVGLAVATCVGLLRRYPPSRWLAAGGCLLVAITSVTLLFRGDHTRRAHPAVDLSGLSRNQEAFQTGQAVGGVLMCLFLVGLSAWMIHRLLFHRSALLYFGIQKNDSSV